MNKQKVGTALFLLGCLLCVNSYIIIQSAQGTARHEVYNTPAEGQFWIPVHYYIVNVLSYVFTQLILGTSAFTTGIIFIYEKPRGD